MHNIAIHRRTRYHDAALALLLLSGCAQVGSVSGTVTYKGQPVPSGTVSFISEGTVREGEIQNGAYTVADVPVGEAKITVVRLDPARPDPYVAVNRARKHVVEGKGATPRQIDRNAVTDISQIADLEKKRHLLPPLYAAPETSGLHLDVVAGSNRLDLDLPEPRSR